MNERNQMDSCTSRKRKRVADAAAAKLCLKKVNAQSRKRATSTRRKWTNEEDIQLTKCVEGYLKANRPIDFKAIARVVSNRTAKQCRERYENSLQPNVKRGEWSVEETLTLVDLIITYAQNWTAINERYPERTYNGIKKRGRKILGEILDRASVKPGFKGKASNKWTSTELRTILNLHQKGTGLMTIAHTMKTGRSEAELDRKLLENCDCCECKARYAKLTATGRFKDNWSRAKARSVKAELIKQLQRTEVKTEKLDSVQIATIPELAFPSMEKEEANNSFFSCYEAFVKSSLKPQSHFDESCGFFDDSMLSDFDSLLNDPVGLDYQIEDELLSFEGIRAF